MSKMSDIGDFFDKLTSRRRRSPAGTESKPRSTRSPRTSKLGPDAVVRIEYTPRLDGDPDPGEVVWAWVPYEEDPEQGKDRPVVVIGRRGAHLIGVPLTSRRRDDEAQVAVGHGSWDSERRPSYARIWRMMTLDPTGVRREGAILERDRFDEVIEAVDEYYDVVGG
ncbi:MAG: type II toxin-antitoxin system PemK/MazF family toxin [Ilumatobacteraceae bacterium]